MPPSPLSPDPLGGLDGWEVAFGGEGAVVARVQERWLEGAVHVVRAATCEDEVETGGISGHQVIVFNRSVAYLREQVRGVPAHVEGAVLAGVVMVGSADWNCQRISTSWTGEISFVSVVLDPAFVDRTVEAAGGDPARAGLSGPLMFSEADPAADRLVRLLGTEAEAERDGHGLGRLYAEGLVQALAAHLLRRYGRAPTLAPRGGLTPLALARAEAYAYAHLAEAISLDDLAEAAGLSPFHFARAFRQTTGETPFGFVRRIRMEAAARLLAERPHWSVLAVALAVGYASPTSFAAAFRDRWGASPSAYRRDRLG